jgi:glycosyltransferase involved in cell wall biosynthesis
VDDPDVAIVQVSHFNALMWDTGPNPVRVIEHAVPPPPPGIRWTGELERGIVVVNDLATRGRRLGLDLVLDLRERVPLDLVGLRSEAVGGLGPVDRGELPAFEAAYRFFFHPARYTSLGLAVVEAMLVGMPVVAPATTEIVTVIEDGRSGIIGTDPARLEAGMRALLADRALAERLGAAGREVAERRFSLERFGRDWEALFADLVASGPARPGRAPERARRPVPDRTPSPTAAEAAA